MPEIHRCVGQPFRCFFTSALRFSSSYSLSLLFPEGKMIQPLLHGLSMPAFPLGRRIYPLGDVEPAQPEHGFDEHPS